MSRFGVVRRRADCNELIGEVDIDPTERNRRLDRFHRRPGEDEPIGIAQRRDQPAIRIAHGDVADVHTLFQAGTNDANERNRRGHAHKRSHTDGRDEPRQPADARASAGVAKRGPELGLVFVGAATDHVHEHADDLGV